MADPVKQRDRQRPFLKVDPKPAATAPDGRGVDCGCFPLKKLGDLDAAAHQVFLESGTLGDLRVALDKAKAAVDSAAEAIRIATLALATAAFFEIPPLLLAVIAFVQTLMSTITDIMDIAEKKIIAVFAKRLLPRACRVMPQWVPVLKGAANNKVSLDQIVEVQGIVTRSYPNPIDVPFAQWHHWHDWTIEVKPDPGFEKVLAPVPNPVRPFDRKPGERPIQADGTIECQWDCGTLFDPKVRNFEPGVPAKKDGSPAPEALPFTGPMAQRAPDGTPIDWAWPMTGQFVWMSGRWVYDCSRSTTDDENGLMGTVLNPCRALATARLEGFKFAENELAVPATQFMFFTCQRGGYLDHEFINDKDYVFIVDLPELEEQEDLPYPLGRTEKTPPDFDHNTLVLRPRLLKHVNTGAFRTAAEPTIEPIIELIPPEKGRVPTHARITIPTSQLEDGVKACGFIISLGWFDVDGAQAAKVRECTVKLARIQGGPDRPGRDKLDDLQLIVDEAKAEIAKEAKARVEKAVKDTLPDFLAGAAIAISNEVIDFFVNKIIGVFLSALVAAIGAIISEVAGSPEEEWLLHVGVNGRWIPFRFDYRGGVANLDGQYKFFLTDKEPIRVAMSGADFDMIGNLMLEPRRKRSLDLDGTVIPWPDIVKPPGDDAQSLALKQRMVRRYAVILLDEFADENDPTGFVDTKHFGLGDQLHDGIFQSVFATRALQDQRTIVEDGTAAITDHALFYSIELKKQVPAEKQPA